MATKLIRQTLYQFGSTVNGASEVGIFGSGVGTPTYTSSITLMQSLGAWNRGWAAETIANNRPFLEDMNAVDCVFGYQLSYALQMGIPEYDTTGNSFYFLNSFVQYSGLVYQVINDNGGTGISATLPTNSTYWKIFAPVVVGYGSPVSKSSGSIYQATTDGIFSAVINTGSSSNGYGTIVTDNSSTPTTVMSQVGSDGSVSGPNGVVGTVIANIKKGDYYQLTLSGTASVTSGPYFRPSGS